MGIGIRTSREGIDWEKVSSLLSYFGLSQEDGATHKLIFERSYAVAFAYDNDKLIGCGRALSDGIAQAAIYNIALEEAYHGKQVGRGIINSLLEQVEGCTVVLYTHPKTVGLYEKFGFRRQKTGMVRLNKSPEEAKWMEETGFILTEGYRFGDNEYER